MKFLIKTLKSSVRSCFYRFGFGLSKLPPKPYKTSKVTSISLGDKTIKIHRGNPLRFTYKINPQYNSSIGTMAAMVKDIHPQAWVVDVGANVGDTLTIIKSKASVPVICVEGDANCYKLLQENARLFVDVSLFNVFLADKVRETSVKFDKGGWNTTLIESKSNSSQTLQFETLDRLVGRMGQGVAVKLLKVDTEGYDMKIIRGAIEILERDKPVISFELNRENIQPLGDSVGDFFDFLVKLGYDNFVLSDENGRLIGALNQNDKGLLLDLYQYSYIGKPIYYYDIWAFHHSDKNLFERFLSAERLKRN